MNQCQNLTRNCLNAHGAESKSEYICSVPMVYTTISCPIFPSQPGYAACSPVSIKSGDRFIPTRAGSNWSINFHYANVGIYHFDTSSFAAVWNLPNVFYAHFLTCS